MKKLVWFCLSLITIAVASLVIESQHGYVLFSLKNWLIQLPLGLFIFSTIFLFLILHGFLHLISSIRHTFRAMGDRRRYQRVFKSEQLTLQSFTALLEKDWHTLLTLLPALYQAGVISLEKKQWLEQECHIKLFMQHVHQKHVTHEQLITSWDSLPKSVRYEPRVMADYVTALLKFDDHDHALQYAKIALKEKWAPDMVTLYSLIRSSNLNKQIKQAESWLDEHPEDPDLLLTLGKLCIQNQLWGKAEDYLHQSLAIRSSQDMLMTLAQFHERRGQADVAQDYYKKAALLTTSRATT